MSIFCCNIYFWIFFSFVLPEKRTRGAEVPATQVPLQKQRNVKVLWCLCPFLPNLFGKGDLDVSALAHPEQPGEWVLAPAGA